MQYKRITNYTKTSLWAFIPIVARHNYFNYFLLHSIVSIKQNWIDSFIIKMILRVKQSIAIKAINLIVIWLAFQV